MASSRYREFFPLFSRMQAVGYKLERGELILTYTEGRTESLTGLSDPEYKGLITHMRSLVDNLVANNVVIRQRRKVIALLCEIGYVTEDKKPDMPRINEWCRSFGHLKLPLNSYFNNDLTKLVYQAEQVYQSFLNDRFK